MIDPVHANEEPGLSAVGPPDEPDAPRGRLSWLWAGAAMLAVIGGGVAINEVSQRYVENAADTEARQEIDTDLAEEMCRDAMRGVGIEQFRVPSYIPGEKGTNLQTPPPWRIGTTVRVVPDSDADRTVLCTLRSR